VDATSTSPASHPDFNAAFNQAAPEALRPRLLALTASPAWADELLAGRPYADTESLLAASDRIVTALPEDEVDAALAGHPRIGEQAGRTLARDQASRSAREQSGMASADEEVRRAMTEGNAVYEERFGRIYLVAAAGRSAEELLTILRHRLDNDPATELDVVREQLARITRLRLTELLAEPSAESTERADASKGLPR
jgi:2-oxo-4-hydroxy-4-carboxy-5-ureidoimidazoline decarboxylase